MKEKYSFPMIKEEKLIKEDVLLSSADHDNHQAGMNDIMQNPEFMM